MRPHEQLARGALDPNPLQGLRPRIPAPRHCPTAGAPGNELPPRSCSQKGHPQAEKQDRVERGCAGDAGGGALAWAWPFCLSRRRPGPGLWAPSTPGRRVAMPAGCPVPCWGVVWRGRSPEGLRRQHQAPGSRDGARPAGRGMCGVGSARSAPVLDVGAGTASGRLEKVCDSGGVRNGGGNAE